MELKRRAAGRVPEEKNNKRCWDRRKKGRGDQMILGKYFFKKAERIGQLCVYIYIFICTYSHIYIAKKNLEEI